MISPELLRRFPIFAGLPPQAFADLAQMADEDMLTADTLLFQEGEEADELYLLLEGSVDLLMNLDEKGDKQIEIETLVAGEIAGWSALIAPHVYKASAAASTLVRVAVLDAVRLRAYIVAHPEHGLRIMEHLAQTIGDRLNHMRIRLISLAV
ncbi:MAG: cyclic nucleotide-binding domain-containing protein [Anaerolineae bacterium]|nr:cyclic nucleotide-binding domain-containing protein [Anaerolineae bacterium]